jgi:hypothetical protein
MDPARYGPQGDAEAPQLLWRLARRNPDVEWVVVGKHGPIPDRSVVPGNVTIVWPEDVTRASVSMDKKGYFCAHCKVYYPGVHTMDVYCCDKAQALKDIERSLIKMSHEELDGMVVHLGQHGTSNYPIPEASGHWRDGKLTHPQATSRNYSEYLTRSLNAMGERTDGRAPVTWICTDPRNYMKARDVKWPTGLDHVLSQYRYSRPSKHERYGDTRDPQALGFTNARWERDREIWIVENSFQQADLELMILDDDWETWGQRPYEERRPIGVATTSMYVDRDEWRRSWLTKTYVVDQFPDAEVFGRWDDKSTEADVIGFTVQRNSVAQFPDLLASWRATVSLPAGTRSLDGIGWSVAKPYQAFAARTACFFVGPVDRQGWVLPSLERTPGAQPVCDGLWSVRGDDWTDEELHLARWLRVQEPGELKKRVDAVNTSRETYEWLTAAQRALLSRRRGQDYLESTIEMQLGIHQ